MYLVTVSLNGVVSTLPAVSAICPSLAPAFTASSVRTVH